MTETNLYHALGLHMHQPPGNLRLLIEANPREAAEIIRCYERAARYALQYRDVARLHVSFSGILLEQFLDPEIVDRYRHIVDIPAMLDLYRQADNIELVGMGYYHPLFPLIARADWQEQLEQGRAIVERVFGRSPRGFWPPEMAFTMDMIPALVRAGYQYVVVDGVHVRPEDGITDIFRPYLACYEGMCIQIVPRDRDVSNAQEGGLSPSWFEGEMGWRTRGSARPTQRRLVTTWSDGENGGWFRQTHEPSGFFGHFFAPYMERCRDGRSIVTPVCLSDYLAGVRPLALARVQTGSWNVGSSAGADLSQWYGSDRQRRAVAEVKRLSGRYWQLCRSGPPEVYQMAGDAMMRARRLILEAETSCFLFWGDAWLPHLYARTEPAERALAEAEEIMRNLPRQSAATSAESGREGQGSDRLADGARPGSPSAS